MMFELLMLDCKYSLVQNVLFPVQLSFSSIPQMPSLEQKMDKDLHIGAHVLACRFPLPNWIPEKTCGEGIDAVWMYIKKDSYGQIEQDVSFR